MEAVWNIYEEAKMTPDQLLSNFARKLEQEAVDWHRGFAYQNHPVLQSIESGCQNTHWKSRLKVLKGGYAGHTWVEIWIDNQSISPRIKMRPHVAAELYVWLRNAFDLIAPEISK